jgi:acyl-CoA reductase-like NAD-dependent aldehyde dehydrogenase
MRRLDSVLNHLSPDVAVPAAAVDDEKEFLRLRTAFLSGKTRKFGWRRQQLTQLVAALEKNKSVLVDAVCRDFNKKNTHENRLTLALAISETKELLAHFETWAR